MDLSWSLIPILGILVAGCASTESAATAVSQVGPYQVNPSGFIPQPLAQLGADPAGSVARKVEDAAGSMFTQPIDDPFILSSQANSWLQAFAGPNTVSGAVLKGQNYYRDALGAWNNPLQALLTLRNGSL